MQTFHLNLIFEGIDLEDDETFDALATIEPATWRMQGSTVWVLVALKARSALEAARSFTLQVLKAVPLARPVRVDEELVAIPDIAQRVGVSREAVRNWANGTRQANFPLPRGLVGDNIKVWRWGAVERWLEVNLGLESQGKRPTDAEIADIDAFFSRFREELASPQTLAAEWIVSHHLDGIQPPMVTLTGEKWGRSGEEVVVTVLSGGGRAIA
jgi:predicted DNA-binding transcriptional regulator AlpA